MEKVEDRLADGKAEAKQMLADVRERWGELRPKAENAIASLEDRIERLVDDPEALKRLPPRALEKIRERMATMRDKLAQATAAYERGDVDLAVEKADAVEQDRAAVEELLVERPEPPGQGSARR